MGLGGGRTTPEDTRKQLEVWVPIDARVEFTLSLIALGQRVCTKERPLCADCPAKAKCPSAFKFTERSNDKAASFFSARSTDAAPRVEATDGDRRGACGASGVEVIVLQDDDDHRTAPLPASLAHTSLHRRGGGVEARGLQEGGWSRERDVQIDIEDAARFTGGGGGGGGGEWEVGARQSPKPAGPTP